MRTYDAQLDTQLPQMYQRIAREQQRFELPLVRRYSKLLHDVQSLVAEVTQVTERVDNALKVTDVLYCNRLYGSVAKKILETLFVLLKYVYYNAVYSVRENFCNTTFMTAQDCPIGQNHDAHYSGI